jgi:3-deoxy-D-manno-octulosonate 8-phosphate phosphatase (KDO 8-P phosphatase)
VWAERSGITVGLLSARTSPTTPHRAAQLGIRLVHQGVTSKLAAYQRIIADERVTDPEVAYMADDIVDLAVLARVGLSAAPADAVPEVRERVDWVSQSNGGDGAARELVETILRAQGRWDAIVASYEGEGAGVGPPSRPVLDRREGHGPNASGVGVGPHADKK